MNPQRYIFQNKIFCRRPKIDEIDKQLFLSLFSPDIDNFYPEAQIDFYSAPNKDEWCRCTRWTFKNLKFIFYEFIEQVFDATFCYDEVKCEGFSWNSPEMKTNIPFGKKIQIQEYKKTNIY